MGNMKIKAVIFDLDGTITQPFFDFDAIRKEMGFAPDTGPILELMEKMTQQQRDDAERILHSYEENGVAESTLNPGAKETLEELRRRGILIGILTRNKKENAFAVAKKHGLKFDAVVGREDGPVKPDAFGVLYLCEKFAITPQEALVVGDYLFDLLCARAAKAIPVLLKNHHKADEFSQYADFVIENIADLLQIIDSRNELGTMQIMEEKHEFQLSPKEFECLKQFVSRDESLAAMLSSQKDVHGRKVTIRLRCAEAEQLRGYLTTHLAAVGFDENYSPNEQGRMLEELIDRFYLR